MSDTTYVRSVTIWIAFAVASMILMAVFASGGANERTTLAQRRLARQNPEIKYDFDRFNTTEERRTTVEDLGDRIRINTDWQRAALTEGKFVMEMVSQLELYRLGFAFVLEPFEPEFLQPDKAVDDRTLRQLKVAGWGVDSAILIDKLNRDLGLNINIDHAGDAVTVDIIALKRTSGKTRFHAYGVVPDSGEFDLYFDTAAWRVEIELDTSILRNLSMVD